MWICGLRLELRKAVRRLVRRSEGVGADCGILRGLNEFNGASRGSW